MRLRAFLVSPPLVRVWFLLIVGASACARSAAPPASAAAAAKATAAPAPVAAPPLALVPADVARAGLVASFVMPSFDRSLASGVALIKQAAPLPLDATGVRDMLLAQAGLPPDLARHIDLTAPLSGASVIGSRPGLPLTAFTFAVRTAGDVPALLAALGRTVARRGAAVQIENAAADRGWFLASGNVVVFADTDEALVRAGSLAIEARRASPDDLSVVLYPEMVARAAATSVKNALARIQLELEERAASGGNKLGPEGTRQLGLLVSYVGEVAAAELALNLDAGRGASLFARLRPKPGSRLEGLARETKTLAVDPALLRASPSGGKDTGIALTSVYGKATLDQVGRLRGNLSNGRGKGEVAAVKLLEALTEGLTGQFSLLGRVEPALSGEIIYPARDVAAAGRIQAALLVADKDVIAAVARAGTKGEGITVNVLRARRVSLGKGQGVHATLGPLLPANADPALRRMLGPKGLDLFAAVVGGDRLAITMGQGAKARMMAITRGEVSKAATVATAAGGAGASSVTADSLASVGPRSLFYFLDLRQVVAVIAMAGANPRFRMLTGAMGTPMPLLGGARGDGQGQAFTLDLTIPPACFTGIGAVIQAAMMTRN